MNILYIGRETKVAKVFNLCPYFETQQIHKASEVRTWGMYQFLSAQIPKSTGQFLESGPTFAGCCLASGWMGNNALFTCPLCKCNDVSKDSTGKIMTLFFMALSIKRTLQNAKNSIGK